MTAVAPSRNVNRRALLVAVGIVVVLLVIGSVLFGGGSGPGGPPGSTNAAAGDAARATRTDVMNALSAQGIQSEDATQPYRPAESGTLATAPRIVLRAIAPDDPGHGFIVIYELANPAAALAAANEQASYIASGVGRVQFPNDTRFVLRVAGSTVVFYAWVPPSAPNAGLANVPAALAGVGVDVPIPG